MDRFLLSFVILALALAGPARADEEEDYVGRTGFFVGLSGTIGAIANDEVDGKTGVSGGFSARVGHRLHSLVAAEVQIEFVDNVVERTRRSDIDVFSLTANAKVYLPPWENGQLYALVGVGGIYRAIESTRDGDRGTVAGRFGAGVEVWLTEHVVATLEAGYVLPGQDLEDLDYVSGNVGLQYRF